MRYSQRLRNAILRKVLPPENQLVSAVSKEFGVSMQTIQRWMSLAKDGTLTMEDAVFPVNNKPLEEKFEFVLEAARLPDTDKGSWLRENGIHEEHLSLWEQELRRAMAKKHDEKNAELAALKKRNKSLERELGRKEKALAELAALLTLKKNSSRTWGATRTTDSCGCSQTGNPAY